MKVTWRMRVLEVNFGFFEVDDEWRWYENSKKKLFLLKSIMSNVKMKLT